MFAKNLSVSQIVICLCGIFFSSVIQAQQRTVEGRITSAYDNAPIEGVQIRLFDSLTVAISDATGYFILEAPENAKLVFYYAALRSDSLIVSGNQFNYIRLSMEDKATSSNDRTILKTSGSASAAVHRDHLNRGVIAGPEQLIQGRVVGVQTTSASGDLAAFTYGVIRGINSLYKNQPLIVLDGIPTSMNQFSPASFDLGYGVKQDRNPLRYINPNDIQEIEVLKDGSAAMYGARGGNGVISITTRNAGYKRKQFEYSSQLTVASERKRLNLLNRQMFLSKIEALGGDKVKADYHYDTDWQSEVLYRAISQKHDFSFNDRYKNGQLRASLGYEDQEGIVHQTSMKRISARLNAQHFLLQNRLTLNTKLLFSRVIDAMAPITTNRNNLMESMISTNPTVSPVPSRDIIISPTDWLQYTSDKMVSNVYWSGLSAACKLTENFKLNINANIDGSGSKRENVYSSLLNYSSGAQSIAMNQQLNVTNTFLEGSIAYDKKLPKGLLSAVLGLSDQRFRNKKSDLAGAGFQSTSLNTITADLSTAGSLLTSALSSSYYNFGYDNSSFFASSLQPIKVETYPRPTGIPVSTVVGSQSQVSNVIRSSFLRVGYEHQQKYFLAAGLRRDASNCFGDEYMAGYFPYATIAWIISKENFFGNNGVYLKARASFGSAGNANLLIDQTKTRYVFFDMHLPNGGNLQQPGSTLIPGNSRLHWETVNQSNLGFDFGSASDRFSGTLDFYNKVTHQMLAYVLAAQPSGVLQNFQNTDTRVMNKGVELSLIARLLHQRNTSVTAGMIFSYNTNKVTSRNSYVLGPVYGDYVSGNFTQRSKAGGQLYEYYLLQFNGFDNSGYTVYGNSNTPKLQNQSPIPAVNTGFNIDLKYKRFYLSTLLAGQFGHYVYNNTANSLLVMGALANTKNITVEAAATKEAKVNQPEVSTRFLEKADFVRLHELVAGYRFAFARSRINQLQISAIAQNLFVITGYSGFDPEVNVSTGSSANAAYGTDYSAYPRARMFTFQVAVNF